MVETNSVAAWVVGVVAVAVVVVLIMVAVSEARRGYRFRRSGGELGVRGSRSRTIPVPVS